jgi:hypothetical protein
MRNLVYVHRRAALPGYPESPATDLPLILRARPQNECLVYQGLRTKMTSNQQFLNTAVNAPNAVPGRIDTQSLTGTSLKTLPPVHDPAEANCGHSADRPGRQKLRERDLWPRKSSSRLSLPTRLAPAAMASLASREE